MFTAGGVAFLKFVKWQAAAAKALSGMTKAEDFSPELVRWLVSSSLCFSACRASTLAFLLSLCLSALHSKTADFGSGWSL